MFLFRFGIYVILPLPILALRGLPTICTHLSLDAGTVLSTRILNPWAKPCQAELSFTNADTLPITFNFSPVGCVGFQIADFTIPKASPNGDAFVSWECGGQRIPSCVQLTISNGLGMPDVSEHMGTSGCVIDTSQTITELVTHTATNGIITDTLTTVLTVPVTSLVLPTSLPTTLSPFTRSTPLVVGSTTRDVGSGSTIVFTNTTSLGGFPYDHEMTNPNKSNFSIALTAGGTAKMTGGGALTMSMPISPGSDSSNTPPAGPATGSGTLSTPAPSSTASTISTAINTPSTGPSTNPAMEMSNTLAPTWETLSTPLQGSAAKSEIQTSNTQVLTTPPAETGPAYGPLGAAPVLHSVIHYHHRYRLGDKCAVGCVFVGKGLVVRRKALEGRSSQYYLHYPQQLFPAILPHVVASSLDINDFREPSISLRLLYAQGDKTPFHNHDAPTRADLQHAG
ncbi:hypothetical protein GQX73_g10271 [Xylaria multiplex]|uniref:Uncharacterized protein n=1 Tax=Xylaria multiplex TaxID=323545 RepID=A0A7C8MIG6_9PEZI|nr:hypothetical protein GQX73_g10271 [Xylaria multiplex]